MLCFKKQWHYLIYVFIYFYTGDFLFLSLYISETIANYQKKNQFLGIPFYINQFLMREKLERLVQVHSTEVEISGSA